MTTIRIGVLALLAGSISGYAQQGEVGAPSSTDELAYERVTPKKFETPYEKFVVYRGATTEAAKSKVRNAIQQEFYTHTSGGPELPPDGYWRHRQINYVLFFVQQDLEQRSRNTLFTAHGAHFEADNLFGSFARDVQSTTRTGEKTFRYTGDFVMHNAMLVGVPSVDYLPPRFAEYFTLPYSALDRFGDISQRPSAVVSVRRDGELIRRYSGKMRTYDADVMTHIDFWLDPPRFWNEKSVGTLIDVRAPLLCAGNDAHVQTWINLVLVNQTPHFACPLNRETKLADLQIFNGTGDRYQASRTLAVQLISGLKENSKWDQKTPGNRKETLNTVTQFISDGVREGHTLGGLAEVINLLYEPMYY